MSLSQVAAIHAAVQLQADQDDLLDRYVQLAGNRFILGNLPPGTNTAQLILP